MDNRYIKNNLPLFVQSPYQYELSSNDMNLSIYGYAANAMSTGSMPLYSINYAVSETMTDLATSIRWDTNSLGTGISALSSDNEYATIDVDDNIRGVSLMCYGDCSSSKVCYEEIVNIHGINWYDPPICVNGGIIRPNKTYTNFSLPSGTFKHTELVNNIPVTTYDTGLMSYSGHFYGIRKYEGLMPNYPYTVTIIGRTGSSEKINIPTEFIDVEYNRYAIRDDVFDYSGTKLIASSPYRHAGDEFGKSVASKGDLLAIGAPKRSFTANSYSLPEAGSVFLYRRVPSKKPLDKRLDNFRISNKID
jgi:hypothetical protein